MALMTADSTLGEAERPLRRDAARNRALILETAAEVFAEHGLDAGYDEIARRAGVGVGTVYRRFPERSELVRALFESRIEEIVAAADEAATMPDAWEGLVWFVERTLERQAADRGLSEVMVASIPDDVHRTIGRDRLAHRVELLVVRAQRAGALRADVAATDLGVHFALLSSVATEAEPELWRRYFAIFLEGVRARPDQTPLPLEPPSDDDIHELMGNARCR